MMIPPKFLENERWYREVRTPDGDTRFEPTPETPADVLPSFEEYYSGPDLTDDDGNSLLFDGWGCG